MTTPLSITGPLLPISRSEKGSKPTFEEQVKEGSAGLGDSQHKYEYNDYRDSSIPEAANKSMGKSPTVESRKDTDNAKVRQLLDRGIGSTVVAVKDKKRRPSKTKSSMRGHVFGLPNSSSDESMGNSPSPPCCPSIPPPTNSPTTGFYDPTRDPRLSAPKGSHLDTSKILADASIALSEAAESAGETQAECAAALQDTKDRQMGYNSDSNDAEDERSDTTTEEEDDGDSDKENTPMTDQDDADLRHKMKAVSIGTKRQCGEGIEEDSEDDKVSESEETQAKKKMPPADQAVSRETELRRIIAEKHAEEDALQAQGFGGSDTYFEAVAVRWRAEEDLTGWWDV